MSWQRPMTKQEADAETMAYFDRKHGEAEAQRLEDDIAAAKAGDLRLLAQLHLRSLSNPVIAQRLDREPGLLEELRKKRT